MMIEHKDRRVSVDRCGEESSLTVYYDGDGIGIRLSKEERVKLGRELLRE